MKDDNMKIFNINCKMCQNHNCSDYGQDLQKPRTCRVFIPPKKCYKCGFEISTSKTTTQHNHTYTYWICKICGIYYGMVNNLIKEVKSND